MVVFTIKHGKVFPVRFPLHQSIEYTIWLFNIAMENGQFFEVYLLKMVMFHGYVK